MCTCAYTLVQALKALIYCFRQCRIYCVYILLHSDQFVNTFLLLMVVQTRTCCQPCAHELLLQKKACFCAAKTDNFLPVAKNVWWGLSIVVTSDGPQAIVVPLFVFDRVSFGGAFRRTWRTRVTETKCASSTRWPEIAVSPVDCRNASMSECPGSVSTVHFYFEVKWRHKSRFAVFQNEACLPLVGFVC